MKEPDRGSLEVRMGFCQSRRCCQGRLLAGSGAESGDSIPGAPAGESWGGGWGRSPELGHLSWEQDLPSIASHS